MSGETRRCQRSCLSSAVKVLACVQGALYGVQSLASGLGLVVFSGIFHFFTQKQHYFPWATMLGLAGLLLVGVAIALSLEVPHHSLPHGEQDKFSTPSSLDREAGDGDAFLGSSTIELEPLPSPSAAMLAVQVKRGSAEPDEHETEAAKPGNIGEQRHDLVAGDSSKSGRGGGESHRLASRIPLGLTHRSPSVEMQRLSIGPQ
jgi:hypothetical protein